MNDAAAPALHFRALAGDLHDGENPRDRQHSLGSFHLDRHNRCHVTLYALARSLFTWRRNDKPIRALTRQEIQVYSGHERRRQYG